MDKHYHVWLRSGTVFVLKAKPYKSRAHANKVAATMRATPADHDAQQATPAPLGDRSAPGRRGRRSRAGSRARRTRRCPHHRTAAMVAHYSAAVAAEQGAVATYL